MRRLIISLTLIVSAFLLIAPGKPSGDYILRKVDENIGADSKTSDSKMIVAGGRVTRTIEFKSWIQGTSKSFTEYLAPAREKGTKMLKLDDQLWIYTPQTDRIIRISGHMLRQSVMGSDLSYEDLMDDAKYAEMYSAEVIREEVYSDRDCWVLKLTAKEEDIAYYSREIWVDKERFIPLKENRYAKSGKLLKYTEVQSVSKYGSRWYPDKMLFKDALKGGKGTEFVIYRINFNTDIPDYIFSKASLRK
ncbi:MAG: outer membrane lipoprotein-sorting protein [candidate division Zixibacteria bacterium]|nr:outer membrane lipoprotein-sorting protein [candidate division Zixibacteria bacterium]